MANEIVLRKTESLVISKPDDVSAQVSGLFTGMREELQDSPYVLEARRVLPVGGYRSAIGTIWNAVIDDLRNKVIHRSVALFNKSVNVGRAVSTYEDFQNHVNDDELIDGAYKIGVIGFEASKILKHAKETRHFFDGHPRSSEPSPFKVLAMFEDCIKYVLSQPFPAQIIDIDDYMTVVNTPSFDRNQIAIEIALSELPDIYKNELANRLYTAYVHPTASSVLRSNIEFIVPILWQVLPKAVQIQIVRRIDQELAKGDAVNTEQAFRFVSIVGASSYLTPAARRYKITPLVERLKKADKFSEEDEAVTELQPWAAVIPPEVVADYVMALTKSYVGWTGSSPQFARTNFYANGAALIIPKMFELFDDRAAEAFVNYVKNDHELKGRLKSAAKVSRLRTLSQIVLRRISESFSERDFLEILADASRESELFGVLFTRNV
jgi:hypothetical protein